MLQDSSSESLHKTSFPNMYDMLYKSEQVPHPASSLGNGSWEPDGLACVLNGVFVFKYSPPVFV